MTRTRVDLVIVEARPWTDGGPIGGADALAIAGGRILAIGRHDEIVALAGPETVTLDARGGTVTPGLTDAHIHLVAWARSRGALELFDCDSRAAALARVARYLAAHPGTGAVVGRGWDENAWSDVPDRASLDAVTGGRPVILHSKDFHSLWVNSAALALAGVSAASPDPPGGRLERDGTGQPNGVVREHAVRMFAALGPRPGDEDDIIRVRDAARALLAEGVTSVHAFEGGDEHRVLRAVTRGAGPRVRVLMHLPHAGLDHALALGLASGTGDDWFRIGSLKLFADGTLGSRTAALLEPYEGSVDQGLELIPRAELAALVSRAASGALACAIHAIGDRAVRSSLDAFASCGPALRLPALAPRIEHVQLLDPADLPRFAALVVAASMQPIHCTSDIANAERHWGARVERSYPWRHLLQSGARLAFGSDAPVESPATAAGLHSAVTRQRADGTPPGGFTPAQRLTLDQAIAAYTEGPARLAGTWPRLGRIAVGATADLAVWSDDLHRLPPGSLAEARVLATVMDGEIVYRRDGAEASVAAVSAGAAAGRAGVDR